MRNLMIPVCPQATRFNRALAGTVIAAARRNEHEALFHDLFGEIRAAVAGG